MVSCGRQEARPDLFFKAAGGPGFRFAVFKDPSPNAFALPNGRVFIRTGLPARLENEYGLHRWVLHRPSRLLPYPYEVHTLVHHETFGGDTSYHVRRPEDRDLILFPWWQAPLLLGIHAPFAVGLQGASGLPVFGGVMAALAAYYGLYEYLHWCMHNPAQRRIERTPIFRALDAHHRLHHRRWRSNFNVVLPIGDLMFGTWQRRSLAPR